ncbi:outer membrane protein assembly factor BamB family protein [Chitinophaga skermanii]|nr:PQQ-binding-like beta-propeller repeat protein [Chitinophaga skermanii]
MKMLLLALLTQVQAHLPMRNDSMQTLQTRWQFSTKDQIRTTPFIIGETIYVGGNDGILYALDKNNGHVRWQKNLQAPIKSDIVGEGKTLYIYTTKGTVYAIQADKGDVTWQVPGEAEKEMDAWDYYTASPAIHPQYIIVGRGNGKVQAIQKQTGKIAWTYDTKAMIHASPIVQDSAVYVGNYKGQLLQIQTHTGKPGWTFQTIGDRHFPAGEIQRAPLLKDGILYFGSRDYNIYAVSASSGRGIWNMKELGSWVIATPTIVDKTMFVGTSDTHRFYALQDGDGSLKWKLPLNMRVYGSAVVQNGTVYFGCFNGKLIGADQQTGKMNYVFQTQGSKANYATVFGPDDHFKPGFELYSDNTPDAEQKILALGAILSTPVVDGKTMYVTSTDGNIYAVALP